MKEIYKEIIRNVPDYQSFMTVDELNASSRALAEAHPDIVSLSEIGKTRAGDPIPCLKIGSGKRKALIFGLPHPNEPIGTMMLEYFTVALAENAALRETLDYTWYIVKAWDADGARLNEGWFKGPFTITNYLRNFFRPAGFAQVDWTYPVDYKLLHFHDSIPQTTAMMRLIDRIKPDFIYALHNSGFGGVYWYMTRPCPPVYDALHQVPAKYGVSLHMGEPESPACTVFSPAIYSSLGIEDEYDYLERYTDAADLEEKIKTWRTGDCSAGYAAKHHGSFTFLTELPYFYDARINDTDPADMTRREAALQKLEADHVMNTEIREILTGMKDALSPDNPFLLAVDNFTEDNDGFLEASRSMLDQNPDYEKTATVAEKFDNLLASKFYKSILYGMLLRAAESELDQLDQRGASILVQNEEAERRAILEAGLKKAAEAFDRVADFLETQLDYQVVPIRKLVGVQLECGLIMADYLQSRAAERSIATE